MESFINTDTITDDEELLEALKHNNKVSSSMKQEIKEIEKLDEANKNMTFKKEKQCFEENDEYDEVLDEDMDYLYYYEPIKEIREDISIDELEKLIKENLPSKNNPNCFKIISRMMAEILKEIMEYEEIKSDSIGEEEIIEETQKLIDLDKRKINFIRNAEEKSKNEDEVKENNLYFLKTTSGNIYCLNDLDKIKNEYYEGFEELFRSIKDGTFKGAKRRFKEKVIGDIVTIDDYAHHPTEVKVTIKGARQKYPDKEIVAILKTHTLSRTKEMANEFAEALKLADKAYIMDVGVDREEVGYDDVTYKIIQEKVPGCEYMSLALVDKLLKHKNAVMIFMSSKDIYVLQEKYEKLLEGEQ